MRTSCTRALRATTEHPGPCVAPRATRPLSRMSKQESPLRESYRRQSAAETSKAGEAGTRFRRVLIEMNATGLQVGVPDLNQSTRGGAMEQQNSIGQISPDGMWRWDGGQ